MKHLLTPDAWRSEAFAEDLFNADEDHRPVSPRVQHGALMGNLIGILPLLLAVCAAALGTWGHLS